MHNKFFGVVAIFLLSGQHIEAQSFNKTQLIISPEPGVYSNLEWVDLDGDNDLDIVELYADINDAQQRFVKFYRNDNQVFTGVTNALGGATADPRSYDFGDFDNDGDIDILFLDSEAVKIIVNNGSFAFSILNTNIDNPGNWHAGLHWKDLDGDLDIDIVFDNIIYLNNSGTYSPALFNMPPYSSNRSWADVNNDGLIDMVATKGQSFAINPLFLFVNEGSGLFKEVGQVSPGYKDTGRTLWLDADADDDLDLLVTESGNKTTLFKNTFSESGQIKFDRIRSFITSDNPVIAAGDINLDGLPDIILGGQGASGYETFLYLNATAGEEIAFAENDLQINPYYISNFNLVDVDRDFDLDLFVMGWNDNSYTTREQHAYKVNPQSSRPNPSVPVNLTSAVESDVALTWEHHDNHGAAYFTIALKRNGVPFGPGNGKLLMPELLALQTAKKTTLRNLPAGNYEWQVQSYDHAYRVSGFSASNAFTITAAPTNVTLDVLAYDRVKINWQFAGAATHFSILRRSTNGALMEIGTVPGGIANFIDEDVPPNEHIEYIVKAISNGIYSAPSSSVAYYSEQFEQVNFNPAWSPIVTASGVSADFDNDQDYDLGFAGYIAFADGNSATLVNNGSGQYSEVAFLPDAVDGSVPLITKDMDNDGDIDVCAVVGGGVVDYKVSVFKNNGTTFTQSFQSSTFFDVSQLSSEDMNNDGLPDLVIKRSIGKAASGMPTYDLLYQTQAGDFIDSKIEFLKDFKYIAALGDFYLTDLNNDGFTDIVFTGAEDGMKARVFVNMMGQAFTETPLTFGLLTNPVFFDFNGDGKMDIMQRGFQILYVHNGLGNLVFDEPYEIPIAGLAQNENIEVKIADVDFNGWPDLIVNDTRNTVLLHNNGHGNFTRADYPFASDWGTHTFLTDMEGDGDLDIVKQGNNNSQQDINYFYKNRSSSSPGDNGAPTAPTSIQMARAKNAITLSWTPSTDDTTPAEFISYHVQIKDSNGKTWLHAETNATGNFRRRLAFGNAGFRTSYTINNLPAGQYTAYVQAVDAAFKLSPLSSVFPFQVTAGPANLTTDRILLNKIKLTWSDGPFVGTKTVVERKSLTSDFEMVAELPANATEYIDDELLYDNLYTYQVYEVVGGISTAGSNLATWNTALLSLQQSTIVNVNGSLDVGDYTGDGKMDLAIHGDRTYNGNVLDFTNAVFEKTVSGWTQQNVGPTSPHNGTSYFYDINGDHKLDVYQHGYFYTEGEYRTQIFLNNGNKTFSETTTPFTAESFTVNGTWDYDRDNDLDYNVMKPDLGLSLLKNNGAGNFSKGEASRACCRFRPISGDFDRDGDEDIVHFNSAENNYQLLLNNEGGLHPNATFPLTAGTMQSLDYNGDGLLDLLFVSGTSVKSKIYKNLGPDDDGLIQFSLVKDDLPSGEVSAIAADYDHDGDIDIFFTGRPSVMANNEGNDVFRENIMPELSAQTNQVRWVDFDTDGDLDVFVMGYLSIDFQEGVDQPFAYVLNNQLLVGGKGITNQAPPAPTSLTAHQDLEGMHLTWTSQADDHTPLDALTHDVVIYKDGKEIVKGSLDPLTEKRFKLENGRASGLALIDSLPYGAYTWKVQAVDQTYMGSPLSVSGQFTFIPQAPAIKDTIIYKCDRPILLTAGANTEWYSDEALTQKVASGNYAPQTSQTVYVTQTVDGMRGVARPVKIDIYDRPEKPVPVINPYLYCESNAGNIATIQVSGNAVQWYKDADKKNGAGLGYQLLIKLSETVYYATQTLGGCESLPAEVVVKPVLIDSEIYLQDDKVYTAEQDGTQYQWYRNNVPVPNSNNYFVDAVNPSDTYSVLIQKEGCSELSEATVITAIEEKESDGLKVYPNPASENFTIEVPALSNEILKIYDVAGQIVYQKTLSEKTIHTLKIHSATWSSGVYFITLTNERDTRVRKIVIR